MFGWVTNSSRRPRLTPRHGHDVRQNMRRMLATGFVSLRTAPTLTTESSIAARRHQNVLGPKAATKHASHHSEGRAQRATEEQKARRCAGLHACRSSLVQQELAEASGTKRKLRRRLRHALRETIYLSRRSSILASASKGRPVFQSGAAIFPNHSNR